MVAKQLRRVRFLLGRAGSGKTFRCLQEIREEVKRQSLGPALILLVPEQATYQMDRALLENGPLSATLRCQVLSFRRLAHLVLQENLNRRRVLSDIGRHMVVQALLHRHRSEWRFFDTDRVRPGLTAHLSRTLHEFRQYRVTPEMLQWVVASLTELHGPDWPLVRKLTDLARLAAAYQEFLTRQCYDSDDIAIMLRQAIPQTTWLRGAKLWVDSFGDFTKQEYELLQALLETVGEATFSLCLDPEVLAEDEHGLETARLFHRAEETYRRLRQLIPGQARIEIVRLPQAGIYPRFRHTELAQIEQQMFADLVTTSAVPLSRGGTDVSGNSASASPNVGQEVTTSSAASGVCAEVPPESQAIPGKDKVICIHLVEATTRRAEVEYAARTIRRLVMEEGWRYRQLAVIVRDLEDYRALIEAIFPDYGIPFFTDQRRSVRHHPLVELLRSAWRVALDNWRRSDVVRWLRTEFPAVVSRCSQAREIIDRLEQYADEHGLDGSIWRARQWRIRQPPGDNLPEYLRPEVLNSERLRMTEPLADFCQQLFEQGSTDARRLQQKIVVRQALLALWQMLEQLRVAETLERWQEQERKAGRLDEAAEHVQVWENLLELLQEVDLALGETQLPLQELVAVLEAGLDSLTLGIVPPALDEVLIGAIERSRQPDLRGVFLLGVNESVFPRLGQDDPVLNDRDREMLQRHGIELAPTSEARHFQEQYLGYIAFTRASERLWVTYASTDDSNRPLLPSAFVERLCRLFPNLKPQRADTISLLNEPSAVLTWHELASALAIQGRSDFAERQGQPFSSEVSSSARQVWLHLLQAYQQPMPAAVGMAVKARDYNRGVSLPAELAQQLFLTGHQLLLTVSELESYAWCPFQFFASSGLGLRPRQSFRLSRQDLGQLLHRVLQHFLSRYVLEFYQVAASADTHGHGERLAESETERHRRLQKVLHDVAEAVIRELDDDRFQKTARRKYVLRQALRILCDYVLALDAQLRVGAFIPHRWELPFGNDQVGSSCLSVALTQTGENPSAESWVIIPRGRVDRIDTVPRTGTDSRPEKSVLNELSGQASSQSPGWIRAVDYKLSPADPNLDRIYYGLDFQLMVYLLVARQLYGEQLRLAGTFYAPLRSPPQSVSKPKDSSWQEWLRGYRLRGVLVDEAAPLFDSQPRSGWSPFVQLFWKKDGTLGQQAHSDAVNGLTLHALLERVRQQLRAIGRNVLQGQIAVQPVRHRQEIPCTLCALASVCRFEPTWDAYRHLPTLSKSEVIQELESCAS